MTGRCVALAAALLFSAAASADPGASLRERTPALAWQEVGRSDDPDDPAEGYVLYEREIEGSGYRALRIELVFDVPPADVVRALRLRLTEPRYAAEGETRTQLALSPHEVVNYSTLRLPLIADRDFSVRMRHSRDTEAGPYRMRWSAADDLAPPPSEDFVRMRSEGFWELHALPDARTRAVQESHIELGGVLPAWIARRMMRKNLLDGVATIRGILRERRADFPEVVYAPSAAPATPAVSAGGAEQPR